MAEKGETRYFSAVDGLRFLASVNVVLFHFEKIGGLYDLRGLPGWLFLIIRGPFFHAGMFFILGGFIFTIKLIPHASHFKIVPFWKKRMRDLYPLHFMTTILAGLLFAVRAWGDVAWGALALSTGVHLSFLFSIFPFAVDGLNRPSWALSAFFLCYLLFKPMLFGVSQLKKRKTVLILMSICLLPSVFWSILFSLVPFSHQTYFFFHVFAPIRMFEFFFGMLLARLFLINDAKARIKAVWKNGLDDFLVIAGVILLYIFLKIRLSWNEPFHYMCYHTWTMPLYGLLIYKLCRERGALAGLFSFSWVRWIGRSSFYPYLLHMPLAGWICWFLEVRLGYKTFMHHTYTLLGFIFLLYVSCAVVRPNVQKRRSGIFMRRRFPL